MVACVPIRRDAFRVRGLQVMPFFPKAQQKGSRLEVGGLGVRELMLNPCKAPASVRKHPPVPASVRKRPQASKKCQ